MPNQFQTTGSGKGLLKDYYVDDTDAVYKYLKKKRRKRFKKRGLLEGNEEA